jgi:hypothetical protein
MDPSKPLTMALEPAKIIKGRIHYADTGRPVPHALITALGRDISGFGPGLTEFESDAEGRFRINPSSAEGYRILAWPPAGESYLATQQLLDWPKGAVEQSLDLALPRGVLIHGTVAEEGSGKPIAGAAVRFIAFEEHQANADARSGSTLSGTGADGSFRLGALPSPGYLSVMAPDDDYVLQALSRRMVDDGHPGGLRSYAHANIRLDLKPGVGEKEVHVRLRRGITVKGRVVGPDGQPVHDALLISRVLLEPTPTPWKFWWRGHADGLARNGHFEIHGLDPDIETPVHFLEPNRKLGATAILSGKSIALMTIANRDGGVAVGATASSSDPSLVRGPIAVRLEPCGSARARLVDPDGKPVAIRLPPRMITLVVTPGSPGTPANERAGLIAADESPLIGVDPVNYGNPPASDADGRLTLPVLIPGATYRFIDYTTVRDPSGPQVRKEFTVKPGESLDLGDILIEKPQALRIR